MNRRLHIPLVLVLMCTIGQAHAQNPSAFADTKLYDAVLDRLFQHDVQPGSPEIQLRYTYCDVGEMQIVVRKLKNSDFQLDVWYLPPDAASVWNQLAQLTSSNHTLNVEAAAASIRTSRKMVTARNSTSLAKLFDEASLLSIPLLNQNTISLDGMAYGSAVRSISEDMSLTLQGPQHSDESNSQMIRWMGNVRSSVEPELKKP
jgi:hypothetical protein